MLIKNLFQKHNISVNGVIHIGASLGQETPIYLAAGAKSILYVEAIPKVYEELKEVQYNWADRCFIQCINACVTDRDGDTIKFNVANNDGQSSSIFEFGTHSKMHPSVKFIETITIKSSRIDTLIDYYQINPKVFDFLVMDIQGAELLALKGCGELLRGFPHIYLEVNQEELYKGCDLVEEIDLYLDKYGFYRVETRWTDCGWGDALYSKN